MSIVNQRDGTRDDHHTKLMGGVALVAVAGIAAAAVCGVQGMTDPRSLGDLAIAIAAAWMAALWLIARCEAQRLERQPEPAECPRRRCLHGPVEAPCRGARLDRIRALVGRFRMQPGAVPTRRTRDLARCLKWFARRCAHAAVALTVAAAVVLLAS